MNYKLFKKENNESRLGLLDIKAEYKGMFIEKRNGQQNETEKSPPNGSLYM